MRLVFTSTSPCSRRCCLACASTASVCSYEARGSRTGCVSRRTVSTFCAKTSSPLSTTVATSAEHTLEIGRERLDGSARVEPLDLTHAGCKVRRATIRQVVAIDRRQHDVLEAHQLHGARGVGGFVGVEPAARVAGVDGAETAGARAHLAHQHDRRGARVPALADVRALGFLAHGGEAMVAHGLLDGLEAGARRQRCPQPAGLAADGVTRCAGERPP